MIEWCVEVVSPVLQWQGAVALWQSRSRRASCLLETWQFEHSELQTLCHCKPALQAELEKTGFERKTLCGTCTQHCDTYSSVTSSPSEQGSGEERSMSMPQRTLQCKPIAHKTWRRTWGELFKILYMQLEARSAESGSTKNLATDKPECCDMKQIMSTVLYMISHAIVQL